MFDRWVNIFFTLALVFTFILVGASQDHTQIIIGIGLALLFSFTAFILNWLTIDGAVSAAIFGSIAYGLGGLVSAAIILVFFISGSILSKDHVSEEGLLRKKFRRNGKQVWANGFWFTTWLLTWFLTEQDAFLIAAVTAIATPTADTWATEIGQNRIKGTTWLITSGKKVEPGTEGGVSIMGTFGAVSGSFLISLVYWLFNMNVGISTFLVIIVIGFFGCLADSYIGARFQNNSYKISSNKIAGNISIEIDNNFVNWISAGIASVISLIIILITSI